MIAQSYQNWELLFVDDTSKDDTINQTVDVIQKIKYVNRVRV